jgi:hypothetical protein
MGFTKELIAPCGINYGVCIAHLREKNKCCGCIAPGTNKVAHCDKCALKFCEEHAKAEFTYCYECPRYPCKRSVSLNKGYTEKYCMSVFDNFDTIKNYGMDEFLEKENIKWKCKVCGSILSVHKNYCFNCKNEYR